MADVEMINDIDAQALTAQGIDPGWMSQFSRDEIERMVAGRENANAVRQEFLRRAQQTLLGQQGAPRAPPAQIGPTQRGRRAYNYVYRKHKVSKGLTAKQIRHLYRHRKKRPVSDATRERIRAMGAINGPALKRARAIAKSQNRKMTKQDFYQAGGIRPRAPAAYNR